MRFIYANSSQNVVRCKPMVFHLKRHDYSCLTKNDAVSIVNQQREIHVILSEYYNFDQRNLNVETKCSGKSGT